MIVLFAPIWGAMVGTFFVLAVALVGLAWVALSVASRVQDDAGDETTVGLFELDEWEER